MAISCLASKSRYGVGLHFHTFGNLATAPTIRNKPVSKPLNKSSADDLLSFEAGKLTSPSARLQARTRRPSCCRVVSQDPACGLWMHDELIYTDTCCPTFTVTSSNQSLLLARCLSYWDNHCDRQQNRWRLIEPGFSRQPLPWKREKNWCSRREWGRL